MAMFLDLPEEIRPLIAKLLGPKTIFSCIRVCRSFYSSFIPFLWADFVVKPKRCHAIAAAYLWANAHWIESLAYTSMLTEEEYYTIAFPRLRTMTLSSYFLSFDSKMPPELPVQKVQFARLNPTIRKLTDFSRGSIPLPREFWEIVRTEWKDFESLEFSGTIQADVVDVFWRVCDRVQDLYLSMMDIQGESHSILQDLSFRQLRSLRIGRNYCIDEMPERMWPLQLITQVKGSAGLRRLTVEVTAFPIELIVEALEEGC
ncbi:hypothetical protein BGX23_009228 [Mortierella sp. AD031]|nr:hypothetical protein BGX23_009228 [Mortierella sp. AD031]